MDQEDEAFRKLFEAVRRKKAKPSDLPDRVIGQVREFEEERMKTPAVVDVYRDALFEAFGSLFSMRDRDDDEGRD